MNRHIEFIRELRRLKEEGASIKLQKSVMDQYMFTIEHNIIGCDLFRAMQNAGMNCFVSNFGENGRVKLCVL
jgi:hypothetical protein